MLRLIKFFIYTLILLTIFFVFYEFLNRRMLLTISLIFQLFIIYKLLLIKKIQFWRITSQFALMILFFNIIPYLILEDDIYLHHFILIFLSQIFFSYYFIYKYQIIWEFEKLRSNKIVKNEKIFIFAIFIICIFLQLDYLILISRFSHEIVLSLLIFLTIYLTGKRNSLIIISILGSIIIYQLYLNGIISGDRRFVVVFGLLLYFYSKFFFNFDINNKVFIFIIPFIFIIFFLIGLYRIGSLNLNFVTIIINLDLLNLLRNIDIGMYSKVYENFFNDPSILSNIKSQYLTGISYEKIFYFFIDRNYWPEKPVLIANYLSKFIGGGATTLAPGLILDIYINFYYFSPLALFLLIKYILFLETKLVTGKDFYSYFYFLNCCIFIIFARGSFEISILLYYTFFIVLFYLSTKIVKVLKN